MKTERLEIEYEDCVYPFQVRPAMDGGTDRIVIDEQFSENVYQLRPDMLRNTGIVVDIGANIGAFSVFASMLGAKRVCAYEPEVENYALLRLNMELNGYTDRLEAFNTGVGRKTESARLMAEQGGSHITLAPFVPGGMVEEIRLVTLENAFIPAGGEDIDVLKIDTEGSEYDIIQGASADVLRRVNHLVMEYHATSAAHFGAMVAKLSQVFHIELFGSYLNGGQLYGRRY